MKLNETQVFNLIKNAYGFVCEYGTLMRLQENVLVADGYFTLENIEGERVVLSYDEVSLNLDSFEAVFKLDKDLYKSKDTDEFVRFTVLTVPNGKSLEDLLK